MKTAINLLHHPETTSQKPYLSLALAILASVAMIIYNYIN